MFYLLHIISHGRVEGGWEGEGGRVVETSKQTEWLCAPLVVIGINSTIRLVIDPLPGGPALLPVTRYVITEP